MTDQMISTDAIATARKARPARCDTPQAPFMLADAQSSDGALVLQRAPAQRGAGRFFELMIGLAMLSYLLAAIAVTLLYPLMWAEYYVEKGFARLRARALALPKMRRISRHNRGSHE